MTQKPKILVHVCCAPCAGPSCLRLLDDAYDIVLFFSNSNICPRDEYEKRLSYVQKLGNIFDAPVIEDTYDHAGWREHIKGLEHEPEQGERCKKCFEYSLRRTALKADELHIEAFTTTLTISPHKNSNVIFEIGAGFPGYIPYNFKKKNGFLQSIELSRQYDLYRQNYCGCEFSIHTKNNEE